MKPEEQKAVEERIAKAKALLSEMQKWKAWMDDVTCVTLITMKKPILDGGWREVDLFPLGQKERIQSHGKAITASLMSFGTAEIERIQAEYDAL